MKTHAVDGITRVVLRDEASAKFPGIHHRARHFDRFRLRRAHPERDLGRESPDERAEGFMFFGRRGNDVSHPLRIPGDWTRRGGLGMLAVMTVPRIAMWSGPRNISTAMMRSFDSRSDSFVADEPLYAAYLAATGLNHPGREVILREQETNWRRVVNMLLADPPDGATVYYQKHMAHHLTPDVELGWIDELCNVFLIREPAAMLVSLQRVIDEPSAEQTGLPQQVALLEHLQTRGKSVPVLLANDVLADPAGMLSQVCAHAKIPFDRHMLHWEAGVTFDRWRVGTVVVRQR